MPKTKIHYERLDIIYRPDIRGLTEHRHNRSGLWLTRFRSEETIAEFRISRSELSSWREFNILHFVKKNKFCRVITPQLYPSWPIVSLSSHGRLQPAAADPREQDRFILHAALFRCRRPVGCVRSSAKWMQACAPYDLRYDGINRKTICNDIYLLHSDGCNISEWMRWFARLAWDWTDIGPQLGMELRFWHLFIG